MPPSVVFICELTLLDCVNAMRFLEGAGETEGDYEWFQIAGALPSRPAAIGAK
jgi:hypothetical protein